MRARFVLGGLAALMAATVPTAGLTPAEIALRGKIPSIIRPYCDADASPPSSLAIAAFTCDTPTSVGVIAEYSSYPSPREAMTAYLAISALMTARGETGYGACPDGPPPGEGVWTSPRTGLPAGRWTCYVRAGEAGMLWTRAASPVLVWSRRPDGRFEPLPRWQAIAGPLEETTAAVPPGSIAALDRDLLRDISAEVASFNCVRVARPANAPWTNALRCDRVGGGDVTYRRYPDKDAALVDYKNTLKSLGMRVGMGGTCTGPGPSERGYPTRGAARGRFACSTGANGVTRLEWLDDARRIRGVVRVPGASQPAVLGWWRTQPR